MTSDERCTGPAEPGGSALGHGHRHVALAVGSALEAWGPDRASCMTETLLGLVESFAELPDTAVTETLPLDAPPGGARDVLSSLLEDVIDTVDVFSVVPVRFHLVETEDGGIAGDMEVAPSDQVELVGPVPKSASVHVFSVEQFPGGWRCRVRIDA